MEDGARVVVIGDQVEHLQAKAAVLRHFWPVRMTCVSEPEHLRQPNSEVAVVCITLKESERQQCVDGLRVRNPKLLIVKMNGYDSGPHAGADAIVDEARGPGALVSTIYQLLTERGLHSRPWPEHVEASWVQ